MGWRLGEPDLVVEMPDAYTLADDGPDVFRNFTIPVDVPGTRYVRGLEFRPGNPRIVHHANIGVDDTGISRDRDARDPEAGFEEMLAGEAAFPDGHILGWTPGRFPFLADEGLSWALHRGTDLVVQLHMLPTGKPEPIRSSIGLFFTDEPPTRTPFIIRLGSLTIDIPAGESDYVISDSFRLPVDVEALGIYPHAHFLARTMKGRAILPDGSTKWLIRIDRWDFNWQDEYRYVEPVSLPRGTTIEMEYVYDNSSDNVLNPNDPPLRIGYGCSTTDEMGDLWIKLMPRSDADRRILEAEYSRKQQAANIESFELLVERDPDDYESRTRLGYLYEAADRGEEARVQCLRALELAPDDPRAHNCLGCALHQLGRLETANLHFQRALELDPDYFDAHFNLGLTLAQQGDRDGAMERFATVVRLRPNHADAHANLGTGLVSLGRADDAIAHFREALEYQPGFVAMHRNIGLALLLEGKSTEAEREFETALDKRPGYPEAHYQLGMISLNRGAFATGVAHLRAAVDGEPGHARARFSLGQALMGQGQAAEALSQLREAVNLMPDAPQPMLVLAWVLATHPDDRIGRPGEAVALAERANALMTSPNMRGLDVLAAGYAAAGRFDEAVTTARRALDAPPDRGAQELAAGVRQRLDLYSAGRSYRASPSP